MSIEAEISIFLPCKHEQRLAPLAPTFSSQCNWLLQAQHSVSDGSFQVQGLLMVSNWQDVSLQRGACFLKEENEENGGGVRMNKVSRNCKNCWGSAGIQFLHDTSRSLWKPGVSKAFPTEMGVLINSKLKALIQFFKKKSKQAWCVFLKNLFRFLAEALRKHCITCSYFSNCTQHCLVYCALIIVWRQLIKWCPKHLPQLLLSL